MTEILCLQQTQFWLSAGIQPIFLYAQVLK